jgi:hypothetical protein
MSAPEDGTSCPVCYHGQIETVVFGEGLDLEVHAKCTGLTGDFGDGCGWEEIYTDNP